MVENNAPKVEKNPEYEAAFRKMRQRKSARRWFNRSSCCVMFAVWVIVMLMPCFFVTLLVNKEIVFSRSDLPEHEYRLFILEETDLRGFGFSRARVESGGADEDNFCMVTSISYLLWEGEGDGLTYCNCYEKAGEDWSPVMVGGDENCEPVDFEFGEVD